MTNTQAHTFATWFEHNSAARVRNTFSSIAATGKVFDRYAEEIFAIVSEAALAAGTNFHELLAEHFGFDLIDNLAVFKWLAVRFACEQTAQEELMLEAA
jgi:hypothetical protein